MSNGKIMVGTNTYRLVFVFDERLFDRYFNIFHHSTIRNHR